MKRLIKRVSEWILLNTHNEFELFLFLETKIIDMGCVVVSEYTIDSYDKHIRDLTFKLTCQGDEIEDLKIMLKASEERYNSKNKPKRSTSATEAIRRNTQKK